MVKDFSDADREDRNSKLRHALDGEDIPSFFYILRKTEKI